MRKALIAIPAQNGTVRVETMATVVGSIDYAGARGWALSYITRSEDSLIARCRNALVAIFLASDADALIMFDSDQGCGPDGFTRLLNHPVDLVGVAVRGRLDPEIYKLNWLNGQAEPDPYTGLIETKDCGTGMLRFSRACLEKMVAHYADREYDAEANEGLPNNRAWALFDTEVRRRKYWGEDLTFCERWRAIGGQVWIDPEIAVEHVGSKRFSGSAGAWLRAQKPMKATEPQKPKIMPLPGSPQFWQGQGQAAQNYGHGEQGCNAIASAYRDLLAAGAFECHPGMIKPRHSVALCIASRGRPELLRKTLQQTIGNVTRQDTAIVVALDKDDETVDEVRRQMAGLRDFSSHHLIISNNLLFSIADREDSLGAKYNRAAAQIEADLYVVGTDDCAIATEGWDARLHQAARNNFPDGIGALAFGTIPVPSGLPSMWAVTRGLIDRMGFFMVPYFPFWWHDTWLDEIAQMIGRVHPVDIKTAYPGGNGKSRGVRDIEFWQKFFDLMRPMRVQTARDIIQSVEDTGEGKRQMLLHNLRSLCWAFEQRGKLLLDEARNRNLEAAIGFDAPTDERYHRIKTAAQYAMDQQAVPDGGYSKAAE